MFCGMILSACAPQGGTPTSTPTFCLPPDTPTPTQTPAPTQTPVPPTAITPQGLNSNFIPSNNFGLGYLSGWIDTYHLVNDQYMDTYNTWLSQNGYSQEQIAKLNPKDKALIFWQNRYNSEILSQAQIYGLNPAMFKGQMLVESNGAIEPLDVYSNVSSADEAKYQKQGCAVIAGTAYCPNNGAAGLMQITNVGIGDGLANVANSDSLLETIYELYRYNGGPDPCSLPQDQCPPDSSQPLPPYDTSKGLYNSYSGYYAWLKTNPKYSSQYSDFNELALRMVDGKCFGDVVPGSRECTPNWIVEEEGVTSIQLAAAIDAYNRKNFIAGGYISEENWNQLSKVDQDKLMIAAYNSGMDGIGEIVNQIIIQKGKLTSWAEFQDELEKDPTKWCQAIVYPNNAVCYGNGGNNCTIEPTDCE